MKEKIELRDEITSEGNTIHVPVVIESRPEYRMYSLVVRQLSTMQKGVQTAHALSNYALYHKDDKDWNDWASEDETLIVLDGGVCQDIRNIESLLGQNNVKYEIFFEPDLDDMITAICFLAPEQVWNRELYPDFRDWCKEKNYPFDEWCKYVNGDEDPLVENVHYKNAYKAYNKAHDEWTEFLGGYQNVFLRNLVSSKRLAQ